MHTDNIKLNIISASILEDQHRVAKQWFNTFKFNEMNDPASTMMKLLFASIAVGDFKVVQSQNNDSDLESPYSHLTIADYISHANRVIIDYQDLDDDFKQELLTYFPTRSKEQNGIFSRSGVHSLKRGEDHIQELVGIEHGLKGQLPECFNPPKDFGLNIAMGGQDQLNFFGKRVKKNGYSGHVYFHHQAEKHALMIGLEQSAPYASLFEFMFKSNAKESKDIQHTHDQFGQAHSLSGAADTFTAAGSLYFNDPLYIAKLLAETDTRPPKKIGGMQVKLTNDNWLQAKQFFCQLNESIVNPDDQPLMTLLLQKPSTAKERADKIKNYIDLNFNVYFKRIEWLLGESEIDRVKYEHYKAHLLTLLDQLKLGRVECYPDLKVCLSEFLELDNYPTSFKQALHRIYYLANKQNQIFCVIDDGFEKLVSRYQDLSNSVDAEQNLRMTTSKPIMDLLTYLANEKPKLAYQDSQVIVTNLIYSLKKNLLDFNKLTDDVTHFQQKCIYDFQNTKEIMSKYENWQVQSKNISYCLYTLVIPYLIAAIINYAYTGHFFFFTDPVSSNLIQACRDTEQKILGPGLCS